MTHRPEIDNIALPYLRKLRKELPQAFNLPFPIMRGGTYRLRNGGYVLVTTVNSDKRMCVGVKSCPDEYGEGFWLWYLDGPPEWAQQARGMPEGAGDHPLDIVQVVSLPDDPPKPSWWRRALRWLGFRVKR